MIVGKLQVIENLRKFVPGELSEESDEGVDCKSGGKSDRRSRRNECQVQNGRRPYSGSF